MDLIAYMQIDDLQSVLDTNGIAVPRLRGLRLMKDETVYTTEEINKNITDAVYNSYDDTLSSYPVGSLEPLWIESSERTNRMLKRYTTYKDYHVTEVKWNKIHGKLRKAMKYHAKHAAKRMSGSLAMWNKYAGRDDVIYIHAKLGSTNWSDTTWKNLAREPWFLDGEDDPSDRAYCNIYAKMRTDVTSAI